MQLDDSPVVDAAASKFKVTCCSELGSTHSVSRL